MAGAGNAEIGLRLAAGPGGAELPPLLSPHAGKTVPSPQQRRCASSPTAAPGAGRPGARIGRPEPARSRACAAGCSPPSRRGCDGLAASARGLAELPRKGSPDAPRAGGGNDAKPPRSRHWGRRSGRSEHAAPGAFTLADAAWRGRRLCDIGEAILSLQTEEETSVLMGSGCVAQAGLPLPIPAPLPAGARACATAWFLPVLGLIQRRLALGQAPCPWGLSAFVCSGFFPLAQMVENYFSSF